MADDFDVIYEVDVADDDASGHVESAFASYVPEPVVIKGAGNITMYAVSRCDISVLYSSVFLWLQNQLINLFVLIKMMLFLHFCLC